MAVSADELELQAPDKFPFPFQPYGIQEEFMRALYCTLEKGCVGIFESPTGTVREAYSLLLNIILGFVVFLCRTVLLCMSITCTVAIHLLCYKW